MKNDLPIQLISPYSHTAIVSPYGFPMEVEYEYDEGEAPILGDLEFAHPGYPPNASLLSCRIGGHEVYDMLSPQQIETIEEAILRTLE